MTRDAFLAKLNSDKVAYLIIGLSILTLFILAFTYNGTGDDGDSIHHYLLAHTAFNRPEHFFDHWAKPVFVLLSAPFAYFGFLGMKIFNVICLSLTLVFTYKICKELKIQNAWLSVLIVMCCPFVLSQSLSGLTEPLFAAFLSIGIYLLIKKDIILSLILLSFLPFVRSEGLIILCVIIIYLFLLKRWKLIPLLLIGHIIYGLLGLIYWDTPLWVFMNIPYAHLSTPYGKGDFIHFYNGMPVVLGIGLNIIWNIGMLYGLYKIITYLLNQKIEKYKFSKDELWLIYGIFSAFFIGHTIFWTFGIFWSFGLLRVFIGVIPFIAIICLNGFNFIFKKIEDINPRFKFPVLLFGAFYCIFFLFKTSNKEMFSLNASQKIQQRIANTYGKEWASKKPKPVLYFNTPYLGMLLQDDYDFFNNSIRKRADQLYDGSALPYYMYYIWDRTYAYYENGGSASKAFGDKRFKHIKTETEYDNSFGETNALHIFMRDTAVLKLKGVLYSFSTDKRKESKWEFIKNDTNRIVALNKSAPYSPGFNEYLKSFSNNSHNKEIRVSFKANAVNISRADWENAKLVISVQKNGKDISWKGISVQQRMSSENKWEELEFRESLPTWNSPDERINIYIWNDNNNLIKIKEFKIELYE